MLIETDILFAHLKEKDWLKNLSERILLGISTGKLGTVYASREVIHELYYLAAELSWKPSESLSRIGALTQIKNLEWLPTTTDTDLLALSLIATYGLTSVFDAYHAASCLLGDPERTIVSTDTIYDKIQNITRIEPQAVVKRLAADEKNEE